MSIHMIMPRPWIATIWFLGLLFATAAATQRYSGGAIGDGQICAGLELGGKDSCQGDSGGPVVAEGEEAEPRQVGIVSWGDVCAKEKAYGVYTRVSNFADWIQKSTGDLQGASWLGPQPNLTSEQLNAFFAQLGGVLKSAKGRLQLSIEGGERRLRLGDKIRIEAQSNASGRLAILDINANRKVMLIYPNSYVKGADVGRISAGDKITIPGPGYGFTSFRATEPTGKHYLVALVVSENFDIERFAAEAGIRAKGLVPLNDPPNYLMQFMQQIENFFGFQSRAQDTASDDLQDWGYAVIEYEITP